MKHHYSVISGAAIAVLAASAIASPGLATPGSGFAPAPSVNGHFGTLTINTADNKSDKWGMNLKTLADTDIGADRLTLQPSGYSGWHAHPAAVFVMVTQGNITWYDGSNPLCPGHDCTVGESFIEGTNGTHDVVDASASQNAEFVAVVIKPAGFAGAAFLRDRDEPSNYNC